MIVCLRLSSISNLAASAAANSVRVSSARFLSSSKPSHCCKPSIGFFKLFLSSAAAAASISLAASSSSRAILILNFTSLQFYSFVCITFSVSNDLIRASNASLSAANLASCSASLFHHVLETRSKQVLLADPTKICVQFPIDQSGF